MNWLMALIVAASVLIGITAALDVRARRRERVGLWLAVAVGGGIGGLVAYAAITAMAMMWR